MEQNTVYIVGHKNPDTDSVCSAIAYAELKNALNGPRHKAMRAGRLNGETAFVLEKFGIKPPEYLSNVSLQVRDMDINKVEGISGETSIKDAWEMMKERGMRTMPIVKDGFLEGLITIGDIATSYMDVHDSGILAKAGTPYANIIRTIDGTPVTWAGGIFDSGKAAIAASGTDIMEDFIEKGDLVILGNRYEAQLCAIDLDAACLVVCKDAKVPEAVRKMAEEKGTVIISSPHDAFTVARLINQSIPVRHFMSRENITSFDDDELVDDIKETMARKRYRDFPVLDETGKFIGLISRRRLLSVRKKKVILVDHNERSQSVDGIADAEILEIIDHHRIGSVQTMEPVFFRNQPLGSTATIIARMYGESNVVPKKNIAAILCAAIISDTLMFRSPTCTDEDRRVCGELAAVAGIDPQALAAEMFNAAGELSGKTAREMCDADYKEFTAENIVFGVSQISSVNSGELTEAREKIRPVLDELIAEKGLDMMFVMFTDVMDESSVILCRGEGAAEMMRDAFGTEEASGEDVRLAGVVSRKKQLVPVVAGHLRQMTRT